MKEADCSILLYQKKTYTNKYNKKNEENRVTNTTASNLDINNNNNTDWFYKIDLIHFFL